MVIYLPFMSANCAFTPGSVFSTLHLMHSVHSQSPASAINMLWFVYSDSDILQKREFHECNVQTTFSA